MKEKNYRLCSGTYIENHKTIPFEQGFFHKFTNHDGSAVAVIELFNGKMILPTIDKISFYK